MKLIIAATLIASSSAMSTGYLNNLATTNAVTGAGIGGYLDALVGGGAPTSGAGLPSYLDAMSGSAPVAAAPVAPAPVAAAPAAPAPVAAAPAAPAPVAAAAPSVAAAEAPSAGDYLSHLAGGHSLSGAGLTTHVDTLATNSAPTGAGLQGYLSALVVNTATSGAGLNTYTDVLLSNTALAEKAPVAAAAGIAAAGAGPAGSGAFLQSVYSQIQGLDSNDVSNSGGQLVKNGEDVVFALGQDKIAMTFIKSGN